MKLLWCALLLVISIPLISFGQGTIQTGFVVITPVFGTGDGLSVSETFGEQVGPNFFQSSVPQSPLVTLTNVVVNTDLNTGLNTGLAIVNPNNSPVSVELTFRNGLGLVTATRTITLAARQQESRFVTEIFAGDPVTAGPMVGSLFISSSAPVGVLGLSFNGFSFTSLPVATQLAANNVTTVGVNSGIAATASIGNPITTVGVNAGITAVAGLPPGVPSDHHCHSRHYHANSGYFPRAYSSTTGVWRDDAVIGCPANRGGDGGAYYNSNNRCHLDLHDGHGTNRYNSLRSNHPRAVCNRISTGHSRCWWNRRALASAGGGWRRMGESNHNRKYIRRDPGRSN